MSAERALPDVSVLGAGIVGVCCTLALLERGRSVELIDAAEPGEGASHGNAGVISPWSCVPQSLPGLWRSVPGWLFDPDGPVSVRWTDLPRTVPWALEFLANGREDKVARTADAMERLVAGNVATYRRWLAGTGREHLLRDSWYVSVLRGGERASLDAAPWRLRIERGAPLEIVDGATLHEIEPALAPDCSGAVVIRDQARAVDPGALCKTLAAKAFAAGATFRRARVRTLGSGPGTRPELVLDSGERLAARRLVVCGGIGSATLLKGSGLRLPLASERGYHLEFIAPGVTLNHSVMDLAGKFVVSSMEGRLRTAGTAEFARAEAPPTPARAERFARLTQRLLPALDTRATRTWMGVRPSFPDSLPAIGAVPSLPGVFAAFGHSHYGLGMAPATGRLVAAMLAGETPNRELAAYAPERFGRRERRARTASGAAH